MEERTDRNSDPWLAVEAAEAIRSHAQKALASAETINLTALLSSRRTDTSGPVIDAVHFFGIPEDGSVIDEANAWVLEAAQLQGSGIHPPGDRAVLAILRVSGDGAFGFSPKALSSLKKSLTDLQFVLTARPLSDGCAEVRVFRLHEDGKWAPSAQFEITLPAAGVESVPGRDRSIRKVVIGIALLLISVATVAFFQVRHSSKPQLHVSTPAIPSLQTSMKGPGSYRLTKNPPGIASGIEVDSMNVTPVGPNIPDYLPPQPISQVMPEPQSFGSKRAIPPYEVMMEIRVEASGKVSNVRLLRPVPAGQEPFADRSIEAAKNWVFQPARIATVPVACKHILVFRYTGASHLSKR